MTVFPLRKSAVMPWAPVNISVDEYEQVVGHKACKDEEILLAFPVNPDVIDIGFYKPYAMVGTVKEENLHGLVCIETAERPEIILSLPPLNFIDVEKCYEILAEDSLKSRTAMAEAYIIGVINSGEFKKAFDDIDSGRSASSLSDYELLEQKVNNSGMPPEVLTEVNRSCFSGNGEGG
ncbi:MAG: hypothetical protein ACI4JZ_04830 [Oscillospiraceae bacterium]